MNVKKSTHTTTPQYPTKRQLLSYGVSLGAAAVALGTIAGGCRHVVTQPESYSTGGVIATEGLPPAEPRENSCVIQKGDTLFAIAQRSLGNGNRWREIVAINPGLAPKRLKVGQTLMLPTPPAQ